ncbi:hypothetical protein [Actinocrinis sp.]|uniref:hypothetical protein n=1 Tax=Actinocrinis sp. TaxID=1920516 RepID=UPI002D3A30A7|nr:hypothetical protein [Actinocrinis sp.]HZP55068.1 hypothetical protein [Actinocrinis sp.]
MTIAPDAAAIHELVDQIQPADYGTVYVILRRLAANTPMLLPTDDTDVDAERPSTAADQQRVSGHRFSFTGIGEGPSDLSTRAKEYLRESLRDGE